MCEKCTLSSGLQSALMHWCSASSARTREPRTLPVSKHSLLWNVTRHGPGAFLVKSTNNEVICSVNTTRASTNNGAILQCTYTIQDEIVWVILFFSARILLELENYEPCIESRIIYTENTKLLKTHARRWNQILGNRLVLSMIWRSSYSKHDDYFCRFCRKTADIIQRFRTRHLKEKSL